MPVVIAEVRGDVKVAEQLVIITERLGKPQGGKQAEISHVSSGPRATRCRV